MNAKTDIKSGHVRVPANTLRIAPENPRQTADETKIKELAESLVENGQLTPLIVYAEGDHHMVTAGSRRYRAMAMLGWTNELVDVAVYEKDDAVHFGVAEQIAHQKLSEVEEVKLIQRYDQSDAKLAQMLGKSVQYVKKHRKVLMLPAEVLELFYDGTLRYEHVLALTYFDNPDSDPQELLAMAQRCCDSPDYWDFERVRNEYTRMFSEWDNSPLAQYVTKAAFAKAGGVLEEDLFGGSAIIKTPKVLKELATKKIAGLVKKEAGKNSIIQAGEDDNLWNYRAGPMVVMWTEAEANEYGALEEKLGEIEEGNVGETDEERDKLEERLEALDEAQMGYPEDVLPHLLTVWKVNQHAKDGYSMRVNVLPEDGPALEPLFEMGYLTRPDEAGSTEGTSGADDTPETDGLSHALSQRILGIKAHARRQFSAAHIDGVFDDFADYLAGKYPLAVQFERDPVELPSVSLKFSKAYQAMEAAAEKGDGKPATIKKKLALQIIKRIRDSQRVDLTPQIIRIYWTIDADFLSAYPKEMLLQMMQGLNEKKALEFASTKKVTICEKLAELAVVNPEWLPVGF